MILIFSDDNETALEILGKGREIADSMKIELGAISFGNEETIFASGADKIYSINIASSSDHIVEVISNLNDQYKPEIILIGGTKLGKEVAPRIAQRSGVGCATDCIDCSIEKGHLIVKRFVLGGRFLETLRLLRKPLIATLLPGKFIKKVDKTRNGEIIKIPYNPVESKVHILEVKKKAPQELKIEEADIIISVGRGLKKKEDIKLIESLAQALGGAVGCSRSIAADLKWLPEERWVGLSGHKVKPKLYIAIGISGQVQHIAGIRDAKTIIAINNDPNAPIFKACDYGIVGDLYEIVPKLTEKLKKQV
ncbi:MAG: electron transfer flavoprotein subunit alpha/FixB family protein [Candidatus Methanoperedens sp.]|nr:electron transfer flavoprotein subunit alpha/FixB family protein [Candidatus Methanoperedens sp.]